MKKIIKIFKNSSKRNQNKILQDIIIIITLFITNLKFQHKPKKNIIFQKSSYKNK
jgi:hypothetical protein